MGPYAYPTAGNSRMTIERNTSVLIYVQIAETLARQIAEGDYPPGERLPSEQELAQRFGVSRMTVRKAIAELLRQGLVIAQQGKGTFVTGPLARYEMGNLQGLYDGLFVKGEYPDTELLEFAPTRPPRIDPAYVDGDSGPLVSLRRLYVMHGTPLALVQAYLTPRASALTRAQAARYPIYVLLDRVLGIRIHEARIHLSARQAGRAAGRLLDLRPRMPVMAMERVSYDEQGRICEHSTFSIRAAGYQFGIRVRGPLGGACGMTLARVDEPAGAPAAAGAP